ncbi:MAG: hypothetical protein IJQ58_12900 [Synergistaceae bacterium]|nr:hypothetical protein [Synergistaceae bacterium]
MAEDDKYILTPGCVIRVGRKWRKYFGVHMYGVYAGNREAIYYSGGMIRKGSVIDFWRMGKTLFSAGKIQVMCFDPDKVNGITLSQSLERAESLIGRKGDEFLCESFALWCRTGYSGFNPEMMNYPEPPDVSNHTPPKLKAINMMLPIAMKAQQTKHGYTTDIVYLRALGMSISNELSDPSMITDA